MTSVSLPSRLRWNQLAFGLAGLLLVLGIGVTVGSVQIHPVETWLILLDWIPGWEISGPDLGLEGTIIRELRLPRVLLAALVGAMLAGAGASYQGVFRNPLADPYLLGVAAGAGLGATLAITTGSTSWFSLPISASLGAGLAVLATFLLGRTVGHRTTTTLILAGVAVAAFFTAMQTYIQQQNADSLREIYGWILGRLATTGWTEVLLVSPYVLGAGLVLLLHRRLLDVLSVGEEEARMLGVNTRRVRGIVVVAATVGTAAVVAVSGLIGFVGIIVPHTLRLFLGVSYRLLLPWSLIGGAAFLVLADLLARTVVAPAELPIGVIAAFVGAPFFVLVLRTNRTVRE